MGADGIPRPGAADEAAGMAEDAVGNSGRPREGLALQPAPGFGQGQPVAEGAGLRRNRPAIPGPLVFARIDDEEQLIEAALVSPRARAIS